MGNSKQEVGNRGQTGRHGLVQKHPAARDCEQCKASVCAGHVNSV